MPARGPLSPRHLRELALLCGGMALLVGVAVILNTSAPGHLALKESTQTAAVGALSVADPDAAEDDTQTTDKVEILESAFTASTCSSPFIWESNGPPQGSIGVMTDGTYTTSPGCYYYDGAQKTVYTPLPGATLLGTDEPSSNPWLYTQTKINGQTNLLYQGSGTSITPAQSDGVPYPPYCGIWNNGSNCPGWTAGFVGGSVKNAVVSFLSMYPTSNETAGQTVIVSTPSVANPYPSMANVTVDSQGNPASGNVSVAPGDQVTIEWACQPFIYETIYPSSNENGSFVDQVGQMLDYGGGGSGTYEQYTYYNRGGFYWEGKDVFYTLPPGNTTGFTGDSWGATTITAPITPGSYPFEVSCGGYSIANGNTYGGTGAGGPMSLTLVVQAPTVPPPPPPPAPQITSFTAGPNPNDGDPDVLTWASTFTNTAAGDNCELGGGSFGTTSNNDGVLSGGTSVSANDSTVADPTAPTTYTITCSRPSPPVTICDYEWPGYATGWRTHTWEASDCNNGLPAAGSSSVGYSLNDAGTGGEADCRSTIQGSEYNNPTVDGATSAYVYCLYAAQLSQPSPPVTICDYEWPADQTGLRTHTWVPSDCNNGLPVPGSSSVGYSLNDAGTRGEADCRSTIQGSEYNNPQKDGSTSAYVYCLYSAQLSQPNPPVTICDYEWPADQTGLRTHTWVPSDCNNGLPVPGSSSVGYSLNDAGTRGEADCRSTIQGSEFNDSQTDGATSAYVYCLYSAQLTPGTDQKQVTVTPTAPLASIEASNANPVIDSSTGVAYSNVQWYAQNADTIEISGDDIATTTCDASELADSSNSSCYPNAANGWYNIGGSEGQPLIYTAPGTYTYMLQYYTPGNDWQSTTTAVTVWPAGTTFCSPSVTSNCVTLCSGTNCSQPPTVCTNGLDISQYPSCSCPSPETQSGSICVPPPSLSPTCTLSPASQSVTVGSQPTLAYTISGSASSASINGISVSDSAGTSSYQPPAPAADTQYYLTVANAAGQNSCGPASVTVTGIPGTIDTPLTASPARVQKGHTTSLAWATSNMQSCELFDNGAVADASVPLSASGFTSPSITSATVFTLSCSDGVNTKTSSAAVTVIPTFEEI